MSPRPRKVIDTSTYSGRFAVRLRELRDKSGMTAQELAEKIGVPLRTYQGWETSHRTPLLESLPAIAEALKVSVAKLLPKK